MKHIITSDKEYYIKHTCDMFGITNYKINEDGSIDVDGDVRLGSKSFVKLPLVFNNVTGNFWCHDSGLTTLVGAPKTLGGSFYCQNNKLTSLYGCTQKVKNFKCDSNELTTLEDGPVEVAEGYWCNNNKLYSLEGCPVKIIRDFDCSYNRLVDLEHCPEFIGGVFAFTGNKVGFLNYFPKTVIGNIIYKSNDLPYFFTMTLNSSSLETKLVIFKYMNYYDVWADDDFDPNAMDQLLVEIEEGLR